MVKMTPLFARVWDAAGSLQDLRKSELKTAIFCCAQMSGIATILWQEPLAKALRTCLDDLLKRLRPRKAHLGRQGADTF